MGTCGVYMIKNTQNNKKYVGSSHNIEYRIHEHFYRLKKGIHTNKHLQLAWNLGIPDHFVGSVLESCEVGVLLEREAFYMDLFTVCNREYGYNMAPTPGAPMRGRKHSEETKAKLKEWRDSTPHPMLGVRRVDMLGDNNMAKRPEVREKISKAFKGVKKNYTIVHSTETREKISKAKLGKKFTEEHKQHIKANHKGARGKTWKWSEESLERARLNPRRLSEQSIQKIKDKKKERDSLRTKEEWAAITAKIQKTKELLRNENPSYGKRRTSVHSEYSAAATEIPCPPKEGVTHTNTIKSSVQEE